MKLSKLIAVLLFVICSYAFAPYDCETTFTVVDCKDVPVAGATITVERCSDKKQFSSVTNNSGQASFSLCKKDICKTKISSVGYEFKVVSKVGNNCNDNNCKIKICSD